MSFSSHKFDGPVESLQTFGNPKASQNMIEAVAAGIDPNVRLRTLHIYTGCPPSTHRRLLVVTAAELHAERRKSNGESEATDPGEQCGRPQVFVTDAEILHLTLLCD